MRESNFSFPVQNRAAVVISSQLYDRRALDTTSPLPLFNSLTHLTYLTSTSPRIRDILTVDGGLERLVRLLREFCTHPPPPQSPREIYGLKPAVRRKSKGKGKARAGSNQVAPVIKGSASGDPSASASSETSSLTSFDRAAAFRFSLAFQCVVNIGVRGSETVRARVVQAGMLDVVSSVLECWLISKGFAVCPSPTGSGAPRESKEVRVARRLELLERRQRDMNTVQATELARALRNLPTYHPNARMHLDRTTGPVVSLPINRRTSLPPVSAQEGNPTISTNTADEMDTSESGPSREPQSSGSASAVEEEAHDEVMETEEDESQALRRRDTIRASSLPRPISQHLAGEASGSAAGPPASSSSSSLPVPVPPSRRPNPFTQSSSGNISDSVSADTSANATPVGGNTPTGSVTIEAHARERSGTVVARPVWDNQQPTGTAGSPSRQRTRRTSAASRAFQPRSDHGTGTDDDNTTEAEGDQQEGHRTGPDGHPARMAVIVQADGENGGGMDMNMIVDQGPLQGVGMGVEQGLVNLDMQANDDLAMGAPPGAPGAVQNALLPPNQQPQIAQAGQMQAVGGIGGATPRQLNDLTPRAGVAPLMTVTPTATNPRTLTAGGTANTTERRGGTGTGQNPPHPTPTAATPAQAITAVQLALNGLSAAGLAASGSSTYGSLEDQSAGPYREEDVLLSLQLLAYLSKYPHVRQAFYKTRVPLGPPLVSPPPSQTPHNARMGLSAAAASILASSTNNARSNVSDSSVPTTASSSTPALVAMVQHAPNVFSLVERFTFRPSPSEMHLPRLPQEIQYWAGVIMRNACRKDETRGGIRQCANMVCGKWESFPREFAKCRRCRKAKYCGKECQSKAWADGHRFWCSSRDAEAADAAAANNAHSGNNGPNEGGPSEGNGGEPGPSNSRRSGRSSGAVRSSGPQSTADREDGSSRPRGPVPPFGASSPTPNLSRPISASRSQHPAFAQEPRALSREELLRLANAAAQQRRAQSIDPQHDSRRREVLAQTALRGPESTAVASSGMPQSASAGSITGSPRPRIMQHAIPPVSSSNNASSPSSMDLDGQRPSSFFRKRAGTLPGRTSPPLTTAAAPSVAPDASMASPGAASIDRGEAEALARQETLREMVNDIITARATQGLPASSALMKVDGDIRLLIENTSLDARERDVEMRRILRDFEYALDQDREDTERSRRSLPGPSSQQTPLVSRRDVGGVHSSGGLDEDGDLRMGTS
ncbi:hypothetical protein FRC01_001824 [Tulasnella sp. 417]|nr:hypothetical protein FRC01_001824 [Tulasnella sp. 417]